MAAHAHGHAHEHAHGADAPTTRELHLLTLGDWGINSPERGQVGAEMGKFAAKKGNHPAAVLLLGDNFYVKLSGADDPLIQSFFEKTYDAKKLNVPFYAVMGNHDYSTGNLPIEMEYARSGKTRLKIPSRWYRLDLPAEKPVATILMLDWHGEYERPRGSHAGADRSR